MLQETSLTFDHLPEAMGEVITLLKTVDTRLHEIQNTQINQINEKLLSANEARQLFQPVVSRVTMQRWTNEGRLKAYHINSRVYYKYTEVIEAAKHLKKYQH
jgi:hypothetical protein